MLYDVNISSYCLISCGPQDLSRKIDRIQNMNCRQENTPNDKVFDWVDVEVFDRNALRDQ